MTILAEPITAPAEPITPMKPSEALRLGAMSTKQGFGSLQDLESYCALGTMMAAFNGNGLSGNGSWSWGYGFDRVSRQLAVTAKTPCGAWWHRRGRDGRRLHSAWNITVHLNDDHRWPRERIADWLESIGL